MTEQPPSRPRAVPTGRLNRFGRLGGVTAGIAGTMALNGLGQLGRGQRPNWRDLLLTPQNVTRLADQLAQMRGAAMKMGQLVSMDAGEVLPPELAAIMARLRNAADTMPPKQLKQVLTEAWGPDWLRRFARFDVRPIAAASIGQVHRARLKDGRDVAIKVQYPGVARSIASDVANVGALMRMSGLLPKGFALGPYLAEATRQLQDEADYAREAAQMDRFATLLADDPRFTVPQLVPDLSTGTIITMTFCAGDPIESAVTCDQSTRDTIAKTLIDLTLAELFSLGAMQTDPNFANYLFDPKTRRIVLLDFGATRDVSPVAMRAYGDVLRAGLADDADALRRAAHEMGILADHTAPDHADRIITMMRMVFAALTANRPFDFAEETLSRELQAQGIALADSGFVPPPLPFDMLLIQRKIGGMFLLAKRLRARVDIVAALDRARLSQQP